jgi:rod shape-determining protein MreD
MAWQVHIRWWLQAIVLLLLQLALFDHITLFDVSRPFPYVFALAMLPMKMARWQTLLIAFSMGLLVDLFNYSYGIHAVACTMVVFIRDFYLHTVLGASEEMEGEMPHMYNLGLSTFLLYVLGLVGMHNLALVALDEMSFDRALLATAELMVNTLFTMLLLIALEIIFFYQKGKNR